MARYDDWVYERGLENESWVHDRWGDDDYDDDFEEELEKGEDDMENNRISFVREYSELEKLALKTKVHRVLVELKEMGVGPCAFKLSEEVVAVYHFNKSKMGILSFKMKDSESYDDFNYDFYTGEYSNLALFLSKWDELKVELLAAKDTFDKKVQDITNITYTKEDGVYFLCKALEQGANIDISTIFDMDSLTFKEKETFIKFGYGYDLYKTEHENYDEYELNKLIEQQLDRERLLSRSKDRCVRKGFDEKLDEWIKDNPDKCLLSKNRK